MKRFTKKIHARFVKLDYIRLLLGLCVLFTSILFRVVIPVEPHDGLAFDELYYIPQSESYLVGKYYFDVHPPLGKLLLAAGEIIVNPTAPQLLDADKLADKVDGYQSPLDIRGARLVPEILGSLTPLLVFIFAAQLLHARKNRSGSILAGVFPFLAGMAIALENAFIVESRYALLNQQMIFFMMLSLVAALDYYFHQGRWRRLGAFLLAAVALGAAVGVKWLALSILPVILILIIKRDFGDLHKLKLWRKLLSVFVNVGIFVYLAFLVYVGIFFVHFSLIRSYSDSANNVTESYRQDLIDGTNQTSFWKKFVNWQELSWDYNKGIGRVDYAKPGEIGSEWVTWPIMARPINYSWRPAGDEMIKSVYLLGNPAVWVLGLLGIMMLTGLGFSRLFSRNNFRFSHLVVLLLYFANWLPFAILPRVFYLYHYLPSLLFSVVAYVMILHDFVAPRLREFDLRGRGKLLLRKLQVNYFWSLVMLGLAGCSLAVIIICFHLYSPLTYYIPIDQTGFDRRILRPEWNIKWPGPTSNP